MFGSSRNAAATLSSALMKISHVPVSSPQMYRLLPTNTVYHLKPCLYLGLVRHGSTHRFSRNMEFFAADDAPIPKIKDSMCMASPSHPATERPLTIVMAWLMSKDSHVKKFVRLYNNLGFDVLKLRVSPFDLLRPTKGSQVVASGMLDFLHQNPRHSPILVHGFSVGAYVFCEGLVQMAADMDRHGPLKERMVGQIWDSVVDVHGIPEGVSKAFTNNTIIQLSIKKYLEYFMRARAATTIHYQRSSDKMHEGFLSCPGLFMLSNSDPVSTPPMNAVVYEKWEKAGTPVFVKIFDKSPHVSHYHRHREAYEMEVLMFLQRLGLVENTRKRLSVT